ncbi:MAG: class I SAM-dependent methyltransferase [Dehalococcoidia bacterium]|nr:class I SAM-dependent methyltransferase [Dehalococcoidia bacterium]
MTSRADLPHPDLQTGAILQELRRELCVLQEASSPSLAGTFVELQATDALGTFVLSNSVQDLDRRSALTPLPFGSDLPLVGLAVAKFRTLWNEVATRWYLQPLLQQQSEFNASVVRFGHLVSQMLRLLQPDEDQEASARRDRQEVSLTKSLAQLELLLGRLQDGVQRTEAPGARAEIAGLTARIALLEGFQSTSGAPPRVGQRQPPSGAPPAAPFDYFGFELQFRGEPAALKERQRLYLEYFPSGPVLDLGCGRGEFVELLGEQGIPASGVDADPGMVAYCIERGLNVTRNDLLAALEGHADAGLAGIFSAQTIEHLAPGDIARLVSLSFQKLAPGGLMVLETINPICLTALATTYTLDLTHRQPVHPDTAAFLARSAGFLEVEVRYLSPVPDHLRLQVFAPIDQLPGSEPWRSMLNANVQRLNDVLFGYQDYALIARKAPALDRGSF